MIFADSHYLSRELLRSFARVVQTFGCSEKSFASLKCPTSSVATIQLTPEQQVMLMQAAPSAFAPVPGGYDSKVTRETD
jgi:hypothetical protein